MITININSESNYTLVTLKGNLDGGQAGPLSQKISLALDPTGEEQEIKTNLIIDISDLRYISSGGLRVLLAFHKRARESNRRMIICNPSSMVSDLLTITGMYGIFQIQPSVASAVKSVISNR